jgi:gliding motility-associated protein GldM
MASGKISPRQKMINMMYLVLLALLALNVSAEILNAFENIKDKLNKSAQNALQNSDSFMKSMREEIKEEMENEGKMDNKGLLDTLTQVENKTSEMIGILNNHLDKMTEIAGRDEETGKLEKKDETEKNIQYWMGKGAEQEANDGRGSAEAYQLHQDLDAYVKYIVDLHNSQIKGEENQDQKLNFEEEKMTADPDKSESVSKQAKKWEYFTFEGPVVANMATLEAMKLDIYEKEKILLDILNSRLGVATFKADKVVAINAPTATIVPAGLQFQTKLFVAMSSSQIQPQFSSSNGKIEKEAGESVATLTIPASGSVIKNGKEGTQSYSASIQVPKATGGFETLTVEGSFTVRKPEIVITSAAIQVLYRNCGNDVNIDVPALGEQYKPRISGTQADVIPSKTTPKKFRIVPKGNTCKVTVNSITNGQTIKIGDVDYKVINPPKPTINMAVNGKLIMVPPWFLKRAVYNLDLNPIRISRQLCQKMRNTEFPVLMYWLSCLLDHQPR